MPARREPCRAETHPSLDQLDVSRFPGLVEPRLQRAVQAQHHVVTLLGNGLDPVALVVWRCRWPEPYGVGSLSTLVIRHDRSVVAIQAGRLLIGLQHGTVLSGIDHERPEIVHGDRAWQRDLVGLSTVEIVSIDIPRGEG